MAVEEIICAVCGANNAANSQRCSSCGARLEVLATETLDEDAAYAQRFQQDGFQWKWVFVSFGVYMALQAVFLVALGMVVTSYDPQGLPGLLISAGIWFVGGMGVAYMTPGKTFMEPAVGAMLAVVPTTAWLMHIADVYELPFLAYIVGGLLGAMVTMLGAFFGEMLKGDKPARA